MIIELHLMPSLKDDDEFNQLYYFEKGTLYLCSINFIKEFLFKKNNIDS